MSSLIPSAVNLGILLVFLFWKLREPTKGYVRGRHSMIRDEVDKSARDLSAARAKFQEFNGRLSSLAGEVAAIREQAKADGSAMKARLIAESKRLSGVISTDAQSAAEAMYADVRGQLRSELATRVLDRAEATLRARLTGDDRVRIRREFSSQVGQGGTIR